MNLEEIKREFDTQDSKYTPSDWAWYFWRGKIKELIAEVERLREAVRWLHHFGREAKGLLEGRNDWPGCIHLCEEGTDIMLKLLEEEVE